MQAAITHHNHEFLEQEDKKISALKYRSNFVSHNTYSGFFGVTFFEPIFLGAGNTCCGLKMRAATRIIFL